MKRATLLLLSLWLGTIAEAQQTMRAHYIDVGQGNATLLEFPCGAILIDAGGKDSTTDTRLFGYLDRFFARRTDLNRTLEAVYITHTHIDHNRALRQMVEDAARGITVKRYVHNGLLNGSGRFAAQFMDTNAAGLGIATQPVLTSAVPSGGLQNSTIDPVACPAIDPEIRILSGQMDEDVEWSSGAFDNGNNHSMVIRVDFGRASFLFTGDLEEEGIETLLERFRGTRLLDVDVYQVGHHGSYNGTTPELLSAMSPRAAVISMSASSDQRTHTAWAYGHPRESAITQLAAAITRTRTPKTVQVATAVKKFKPYLMRKAVFATGWDGNVVVYANSNGDLRVQPFPNN